MFYFLINSVFLDTANTFSNRWFDGEVIYDEYSALFVFEFVRGGESAVDDDGDLGIDDVKIEEGTCGMGNNNY